MPPGGGAVTNEALAVLLKSQHEAITERLDILTEKVETTNGRLRAAEIAIAVLQAGRPVTPQHIGSGQIATGLAVAGAAVWGVVQVLFKLGDLFKAMGLR